MTDPNKTQLVLVVDRSGSMSDHNYHKEMEGAIGTFLAEQKAVPGVCDLYVAIFDDHYDVVYDSDLQGAFDVAIVPRGSTAMLGAIGRTIDDVGTKLAAKPEDQRPATVIVAIITDGYENHSQNEEWSRKYGSRADYSIVKAMVERQIERYGWHFTYLGANQDAVTVGSSLGVPTFASMTTQPTAQSAYGTMDVLSGSVTRTRTSGKSIAYTDEDRRRANQ